MPDSQPNYLTTDINGRVGAEFSGHISAAGVDLDAGNDSSPPSDRKVRWLRESDGSVVAEIYGYEDETDGTRALNALVTGLPGEKANAFFGSQDDDGQSASIIAGVDDAANTQRITAFAGANSRVILNEANQSGFAQVSGALQRMEFQWTGANLNVFVNGVLVRSL